MPRFRDGDFVVQRDVVWNSRKGQRGKIVQRLPTRQNADSKFDRYIVFFSDGQQEEVWDTQLEKPIFVSKQPLSH